MKMVTCHGHRNGLLETTARRLRHLLIALLFLPMVQSPTAWAGYSETDTYEDQSGHFNGLHAATPGTYPMGYAGFVPGITNPMTGHHPGVLVPDSENVFSIYGHGTTDVFGRGSDDQVEYGWSVVLDPATPGSGADFTVPGTWDDWVNRHIIFSPPGHGSFPVSFPKTTAGQHVGPGYESGDCTLTQYCWKTAAPPFILYAPGGGASGLGSDPQTGYDFIDSAKDLLVGPYSGFEYSDIDSLGYEPTAMDDPASPMVFNTTLEPYERIHTQNFLVQDDVRFSDDTFTYVPWAEGEGVGLDLHVIIPDLSSMPVIPSAFPGTDAMVFDPNASFDRTYFVDNFRIWDHTQDTNVTRDWGCDPNAVSDPRDCLIASPDGKTDEKFEIYVTREIDFAFLTSSYSLEQKWGMFDITIHDEGLADHIITDNTSTRTDGNGDPLYWYADYVYYAVDQHHLQKMEDSGTFATGKDFDVISAMKYVVVHQKSPIYPEIDPDRRIVDYYTPIPLVHNEFGGHGDVSATLYIPDISSHDP